MSVNEKQAIEKGTAEGFLDLYNERTGHDFKIVRMSDAPDVCCEDSLGGTLNIEITVTEDCPGDIKAALGRSENRSLKTLRARVDRVARGEEAVQINSLLSNVIDQLVERIMDKMKKDYGPNAALVVRDSSGVNWDWDDVIPSINSRLGSMRSPFSHGIWLLSRAKDRLFKIR